VGPAPVDLVAGTVTVTPANPTTTQAVTLSASVANAGTATANNATWRLKLDGAVAGSGTIASLAAGASTPVSAANLGPYAAVAHTATLEVDFANAIPESNESNNTSTTTFTVTGLPDLVAGPITVTPANPTAV